MSTSARRFEAESVRALRWLPPILWTGFILWMSSDTWSAQRTGHVLLPFLRHLLPGGSPELLDAAHWLVRKAAHVTEYAVLAVLWSRAVPGWRWPLGLSMATAIVDETRQAMTLSRTPSPVDVIIDSAAAAVALAWLRLGWPRAVLEPVVDALLWTAAVGGSALLALSMAAGARAGWLWSAPAAWLALWIRARRRRAG